MLPFFIYSKYTNCCRRVWETGKLAPAAKYIPMVHGLSGFGSARNQRLLEHADGLVTRLDAR
ncbi:hypothetical protein M758_4G067400 [Ceratodon purpureus]|nr:hypothetical protein M758_4G067400 [Ceratodon purpureus]